MATAPVHQGPARKAGVPPSLAPERRRSLPLLWAGLLSAAVGGVVFASVALSLDDRRPVLALARSLPAGARIAPSDLRVILVGADSDLLVVPAGERRAVIGRVSAVPLAKGSLLSPGALGRKATLASDEAAVGLLLEPGTYPPGLRPGDRVAAVATRDDRAVGATELATGLVESMEPAPGASGAVVGLRLPRNGAAAVAGAAASRRLVLVLVPTD